MFLCVTLVVHNEDLEITKQALHIEILATCRVKSFVDFFAVLLQFEWQQLACYRKVQMSFVFVEEL